MTSRAKVADYVADQLREHRHKAITAAAAWLVENGRSRQAEYLARDVAAVLAERGYVYAKVTTARPLTHHARDEVALFIRKATGAKELELETRVDASLIGGAIIETPGAELDSSVRTRLARFVEGVQHA